MEILESGNWVWVVVVIAAVLVVLVAAYAAMPPTEPWTAPSCPGYGSVYIVIPVQGTNNPDPETAMDALDKNGWQNITFHMGRGTDRVTAECPQERQQLNTKSAIQIPGLETPTPPTNKR